MSSQNITGGAESTESTGLTEGGILKANANPALFDISDGNGVVVDNYTDPDNAIKTLVSWSGETALTITNLATEAFTFIGINAAGSVIQQNTPFTDSQERDLIVLGLLGHSDNVAVGAVYHNPNTRFDYGLQMGDFIKALGPVNTTGNVFSANGNNLSVDRSAGTIYRVGSNYAVDKQNPSVTSQPFVAPQEVHPQFRDGGGGFDTKDAQGSLDVGFYDDGSGTLAVVPNNARWQTQRLWVLDDGQSIAIYGQSTFSDMAEAEASITASTFETSPITSAFGVLRGWVIVSLDTIDLSDPDQAKFIVASSIASGTEPPVSGGGTADPTGSMLVTSLNNGGILSENTTTTFDISDGNGWVVDNYTDPDNPIETKLAWAGLTNITVTDIGTQPRTFVGINKSGVVIQQAIEFTPEQRRDIILIGAVRHEDEIAISGTSTIPVTRFDLSSQFVDFVKVVGSLNVGGNVISASGANLNIARSAGQIYRFGANYESDKQSPSISTEAAADPQSFDLTYQDGVGAFTTTAVTQTIDPNNYDDGSGTLASVTNNWYQNLRVWVFSSGFVSIMYDQNQYQTEDDALAARLGATFNADPILISQATLRCWITVQQGTTDLSIDTIFTEASKFSGVSGGVSSSTGTLQQAYNNSVPPETILTGVSGPMAVRDNVAPLGTTLYELTDSTGATLYFGVDANGIIAPAAAIQNGDLVLAKDISDSNILKQFTAQSIANLALAGLGTMSTQNANAVAITGGTIGGAVTGATQAPDDNSTKFATTAYVDAAAGGGGPGMVFLGSLVISNDSFLDFDNIFDGTYEEYKIFISRWICAVDSNSVNLRYGVGGTPTYQSGTADYGWAYSGTTTSATGDADQSDAQIRLMGNSLTVGNAAFENCNFDICFHDPASSATSAFISGSGAQVRAAGTMIASSHAGRALFNTAVTSARFFCGSGDATSGLIKVFGVAKS